MAKVVSKPSGTYRPRKITVDLIRQLAKAAPPNKPKEVRDKEYGLILRHQPKSGALLLYVQTGRGRRERPFGETCDARRIIDPKDELMLNQVRNESKRIRGAVAGGRDFKSERDSKRGIPTFNDFLEDDYGPYILRELRSGQEQTNSLKACFGKSFGKLRLDEIDVSRVKKWRRDRRRARNVVAKTINRNVADLHAMLSYAVHEAEVLAEHPLANLKPLKVNNEIIVRALEADEERRLREALAARDDKKRAQRASANEWRTVRKRKSLPAISTYADTLTPAALVSIETGLRRNELFTLEWPLVDWKKRELHVTAATAKTERMRTVPLNKGALHVLRSWWLQQAQPEDGLVFPGAKGKLTSLRKAYYSVLKDAGIERINAKGERINWHSLRHSFGSRLGAQNVDPTTIMKLMGHTSLDTTRRYLHSEASRMRAAVDRLA